jgi:hypothetical protein
MLADHVVVSFLALKHAELLDAAAAGSEASGVAARRVTACQKRQVAAVRWLQTVQRKTAHGVTPRSKLKIFSGGAEPG